MHQHAIKVYTFYHLVRAQVFGLVCALTLNQSVASVCNHNVFFIIILIL